MRDATRLYLQRFGIEARIQTNIANLRDALLLVDLCGLPDARSRERAAFVERALDLIESKREEMLEVYARNFEAIFSDEETRAVLKYEANVEALELQMLHDVREIFQPLLRKHNLETADRASFVEVSSKQELDRELSAALDDAVALFGPTKKTYEA